MLIMIGGIFLKKTLRSSIGGWRNAQLAIPGSMPDKNIYPLNKFTARRCLGGPWWSPSGQQARLLLLRSEFIDW